MSKQELQKQLELKYNKENLGSLLEPMKKGILEAPLNYVNAWIEQDINFAERPDLIDVMHAVKHLDAEEICWALITKVLLDESISIQGAMGMFFSNIGKYCPMPYRRGHVLNVYIQAICSSGLIEVKNMGKYNHLMATVSMGDRGQRNYGFTLPSIIPHKVKSNRNAAYEHMHVITGGKLKQHDGELCLDHIERLSNIAYKVEDRLIDMIKPVFEEAPKYKERKGRHETAEEVEERRKDFIQFNHELPTRVYLMMANGNEFYFGHRYDTRLRTYLKAYHFDFIGNKYCRAFVQPVKGKLVTGAEEYV